MNEMTQVLGVVAMEPKGNYDASTYYEKLNTVLYNDSTYMAKEGVVGEDPSTSSKWQLIGGGVRREDIVDNLDSNDATKMLSAKQGKVLNEGKVQVFDTVALMKTANLKNGMTAQTLGYYAKNDGGGADYKITDTQSNSEFQEELDNDLYATLIINNKTNARMFGAYGDGTHDDSSYITSMLNFVGRVILSNGTYKTTQTITLHSNEEICGENRYNTIINYTGNGDCITNEDVSTSNHICIHDLTINGSNRTGNGIYLIRTTKQNDTYHRLYNLVIKNFEYGIKLEKNLNEIQLSDIICGTNDYGIYANLLNDFYMEKIICCVNNKHGIYLSNSTEGRISDSKFWYNGSSDADSYYNLALASCTALMLSNIGCQESYGSNMLLSYSKNLSIINCYLSLPCLDGNEHHQIHIDQLQDSNLEIYCANKKVEGSYINKILRASNGNRRNNVYIHVEDDFPEANLLSQISSNNGYGFNLVNNITLNNKLLNINKNINYIVNGNLTDTSDITKFVASGDSYCSINNNNLRITNSTSSSISVNFKHPALPRKGLYTFYILFKKVSGTGRVVAYYSGYKDVSNDTSTSDVLYASYCLNKTSESAATNINLSVPANMTIDILEIGLCEGVTCNSGNPLYKNSEL